MEYSLFMRFFVQQKTAKQKELFLQQKSILRSKETETAHRDVATFYVAKSRVNFGVSLGSKTELLSELSGGGVGAGETLRK